MTREEQIAEYVRCKKDPIYFIEHYILIELPGEEVLFKLYNKQKEYITKLLEDHFLVALKSRQTGLSTVIQALCTWLDVFHENIHIGVISKDGRESTRFARIIRGMIEKLPTWLKPPKGAAGIGFRKASEQYFELTNGSSVTANTVDPKAPSKTLRGRTLSWLIIDEAAFIDKLDEAYTAIIPAVSTAQKNARKLNIPYGIAIVSTPNRTVGMGKFFFNKYSNALNIEKDENRTQGSFSSFVYYWKDIPELADDPFWFKQMCEQFDNDDKKIGQELDLRFVSIEGSFFDENTCTILQEYTKNTKIVEVKKLFNGECWTFEKPISGKNYIIGIDTASEYGTDMSAITIWDYETLDQMWEYRGKLPVTDFCKVAEYACALYPGVVVPENNSLGNQIAEYLDRSPYGSMLYKYRKSENTMVRGITTDLKTRPLMIDSLYSYVTQYPQMVKSKRLALELVGLITKPSGKVEADSGCNDDIALSLAFCCYVRKYDPPLMLSAADGKINEELRNILMMNASDKNIFAKYKADADEEDLMDTDKFESDMADLNARVLKRAKKETDSFTNNFVNTLEYYRS